MARVTVVGSVNFDTIYGVEELPRPGQTLLAHSAQSGPGGKGGNQAIAAARAGAAVQLVSAFGTDEAAGRLREHLGRNGVGLDGSITLPTSSGAAIILVERSGENMIVVAPGANGHLALDSPIARDVVADADVVLLQLEIPVPTAIAAARTARQGGAAVLLNASPLADDGSRNLAELASVVDVVIVNETEAQRWSWPVEGLVITRGARGALYRMADGTEITVAAPAVEVIDTAGAGDVFAGVLAAGWTGDREQALRRACVAGALATLAGGAGDCAPTAEAIDDVLNLD